MSQIQPSQRRWNPPVDNYLVPGMDTTLHVRDRLGVSNKSGSQDFGLSPIIARSRGVR